MHSFLDDLRYGARLLRRNPGFAAVAVVTLGLGIGANTAIFSVVSSVLLRSLPYADPDRVMMIWSEVPQRGWTNNIVYPADYLDWKVEARSFSRISAFGEQSYNLTGNGDPVEMAGAAVAADLFPLLGVTPALGRTFTADEDRPGAVRVVMLGYALWQQRYGGDREITGKSIRINGENLTVVGVMPPGFHFPPWNVHGQVWIPLGLDTVAPSRSTHELSVMARLKPGIPVEQAQAEMTLIARRIEREHPVTNAGWTARVSPLHDDLVEYTRPALIVLMAAVCLVLLIACANVANLLIARAVVRERETAVRNALGAGRVRLVRQFLTESVLLGLMGGALGLVLAFWGVRFLVFIAPPGTPGIELVQIDARVLGFTLAVSLVTVLVFGLAPSLAGARFDVNEALKQAGRTGSGTAGKARVRAMLVVSEFALALVLLVAAGLMIRSFVLLHRIDPGFKPDHVVAATVPLLNARYSDPGEQSRFFDSVLSRIEALPGVEAATNVVTVPLEGNVGMGFVTEENPNPRPGEMPDTNYQVIGPHYFRTLRIPILRGREFTSRDRQGSPGVAIVNEALARLYFPHGDAVGKRLKVGREKGPWLQVVGVAASIRHRSIELEPAPELFVPYAQYPWLTRPRHLLVRTSSDPAPFGAAITAEVRSVDKDQPVSDIRAMDTVVGRSMARTRFSMSLLAAFGALALVLAGVGIYGVVAWSVTQRTREIGIRMALGAGRSQVLWLVLARGACLAGVGVAIGIFGALAAARMLAGLVYGITITDPLTFASISLVLSVVGLAASYFPARRATKVDPMIALRYE
jgi:putative ABC transport system permease protein